MKKTHIILLVGIVVLITALISFSADFSTYDSIDSAKKSGKDVHIVAMLDRSEPIIYDPLKDPNFLSFHAKDSLGGFTKVIYRKGKPTELEKSERLVMKGRMNGDHFECSDILLKCPSKYKDDKQNLERSVPATASS